MPSTDSELRQHFDVVEQALIGMKAAGLEQAEISLTAIGAALRSSAETNAATRARLTRLQALASQGHALLETRFVGERSLSPCYTPAGVLNAPAPASLRGVEA